MEQTATAPSLHEPITAFIAYSHKDIRHLAKLHDHLSPLRNQGRLDDWHDRQIDPGQEWEQKIDDRLFNDRIILLLVSSNFLASKYCWEKEMTVALDRHEVQDAIVIPIIVSDCDWQIAPFRALEALPEKGKAVTRWSNRESAWRNVAEGVRRVLDSLQGGQDASGIAGTSSATRRHGRIREENQAILRVVPHDDHAGPWIYRISSGQASADVKFDVENIGKAPARDVTTWVSIGDSPRVEGTSVRLIPSLGKHRLGFVLPFPKPFPGAPDSPVPDDYPDSPLIDLVLRYKDFHHELGEQETEPFCFRFARSTDRARWRPRVEPCDSSRLRLSQSSATPRLPGLTHEENEILRQLVRRAATKHSLFNPSITSRRAGDNEWAYYSDLKRGIVGQSFDPEDKENFTPSRDFLQQLVPTYVSPEVHRTNTVYHLNRVLFVAYGFESPVG